MKLISSSRPPSNEELEISMFGPGYGESIALHLGDSKWIIIDSCIEPDSSEPAPLRYLQKLGVNIQDSVKLIIATHWHDDHIRGLSRLLNECKSAFLVISNALLSKEFVKLVESYKKGFPIYSSGVEEFIRIFNMLEERKSQAAFLIAPKLAISDRLLYKTPINLPAKTIDANVYSLSPSDTSALLAIQIFSKLFPSYRSNRKGVVSMNPNYTSIVTWVEIGAYRILLGADLQNTKNPGTGWTIILDTSTVISGKADVFKVAHHGSVNAHEPRVWSNVLTQKPIAILSPYFLAGNYLPSSNDISRLVSLTPEAYITAPPRKSVSKWSNKIVRETVESMTREIRSVNYGWGQITLRSNMSNSPVAWQTQLFGDAIKLN